jgi:hypothetical protein
LDDFCGFFFYCFPGFSRRRKRRLDSLAKIGKKWQKNFREIVAEISTLQSRPAVFFDENKTLFFSSVNFSCETRHKAGYLAAFYLYVKSRAKRSKNV